MFQVCAVTGERIALELCPINFSRKNPLGETLLFLSVTPSLLSVRTQSQRISQPGPNCFHLQEHNVLGLTGLHCIWGKCNSRGLVMDWAVYFFVLSFQYPPQRVYTVCQCWSTAVKWACCCLLLSSWKSGPDRQRTLLRCSEAVQRKIKSSFLLIQTLSLQCCWCWKNILH